ncbi:putative conserved membrane protein [Synechococcus sp. SYN20]|nr:putative conserved membrane protein [Synechococcus sp. MVIR-18-1]QNJ26565.1 putative conserved membrane protein [Synechococcus sp. SYN20]
MTIPLNSPSVSLLIVGVFFGVLQVWWIRSLWFRNAARQKAQPLSSKQFRKDLERIFKNEF